MTDASGGPQATRPPGSPSSDRRVRPGIVFYLFLALLTVGAGAALWGIRSNRESRLHAQEVALRREMSAGVPVRVTKPRMTGDTSELLLPGDVRSYFESPLYAKVSGYLKKLYVDKGDRVKEGQLLAELETPETEQEYRTAKANYDIAKITDDRYQDLVRDRTISQQQADRARADLLMAKANMDRLRAILEYQRLRAPFNGIVIARNYDPGTLVPAATTTIAAASTPVLVVARIDRLRVYVYVPQSHAAFIRIGDPARIMFDEFPGRIFEGRVTRFSRALDASTRTMLTEIDLPNADHALLPGMYAEVRHRLQRPGSYPIVSDEVLVFRNEKVFVPVITPQNTIHLQPVTLGFDNGIEVQITEGLTGTESIAVGVGQTVAEGLKVFPIVPKDSKPSAAPAPAAPPAATR